MNYYNAKFELIGSTKEEAREWIKKNNYSLQLYSQVEGWPMRIHTYQFAEEWKATFDEDANLPFFIQTYIRENKTFYGGPKD